MENDAKLRKYYDFDDADLYANRNGHLTPRQKAREEKDARATKKILLVAGIVLLALAFLPYVYFWWVSRPGWEFYLIWSLTWVPLWTFLGILLLRMARVTTAIDTVKTVEGPLNLFVETKKMQHSSYESYTLHVGGVEFDENSDLADIITQGDYYAVYYLDAGKEILSMERLPNKQKI